MGDRQEALRGLPGVGRLLATEGIQRLVERCGHAAVVAHLRDELADHRRRLREAAPPAGPPGVDQLTEGVRRRIAARERSAALRPVINATGVLLHTGLGRAPLADAAARAVGDVARGYANVELDLDTGERGRRMRVVETLLCEASGAEAALVVNNNAAATVLALAATAAGREVVVSRGELIEIGGGFRLPEIMAASGAILREVGTTNKTRPGDYAAAIGEQTGALLRVHPSNYVVVGFTSQATLPELVALGRRHRLPVVHDIGSGALIDFARFGFRGEPVVERSVREGADLVLFSGDKLLGGPQCGVLVGRREAVERAGRHPLARAMRVDKLTLAALAATLELYRDPERALQTIPLLRLLTVPLEQLRARARAIADAVATVPGIARARAVEDTAYLGGGSVPTQQQPTSCVAIELGEASVDRFARALRLGDPAVVPRVRNDRVLLDLRSVFPDEDPRLIEAVRRAASRRR